MPERRSERRFNVLMQAKVLLTEWDSLDCVVRDISPGGARLDFGHPARLPSVFRLCVLAADLTIPAAIAWQDRGEVGIRFTGVGQVGVIDDSRLPLIRAAA